MKSEKESRAQLTTFSISDKSMLSKVYPDLQFNSFVLPEDSFDLEVDADGRDERGRERVVGVPDRAKWNQ